VSILIDKRALPRARQPVPAEITAALEKLPQAFGQLGLQGGDAANLQIKALKGQPGLYRLRVGDQRVCFLRAGEDFHVFAIGHRRDIYQRIGRMRLSRKADGVRVIEVRAPRRHESGAEERVFQRPTSQAMGEQPNPLMSFSNPELLRIEGVDEDLVAYLRTIPRSVDIGLVLGEALDDAELAALLVDMWERPEVHLQTIEEGGEPSRRTVEIDVDELGHRLRSADSETEMIRAEGGTIARLLDGTIEDWMVYLQPDQRGIANAELNGPSRVRGGPGTGKTVVALHRARVLARMVAGEGEEVLLTTFLRTLPEVWKGLMGLLDAKALENLCVENLDAIAFRIVAENGERPNIMPQPERIQIARTLLAEHRLFRRFAGNASLLLEEFDAFITGRNLDDPVDYLTIDRRGGGSAFGRSDREKVLAAYRAYLEQLEHRGMCDFALVRHRALELAEAGKSPTYAGVVVDEAQDLTEVGIRLLAALDSSRDHRYMTIVGDGQQSIYPGGFSLRSVGLDVRGRSYVLTSNWRNTWSIWMAAKAVMEGQSFDDLDDDVGLRPTGQEPEPLSMGEPATLHVLPAGTDELELLGILIRDRIDGGVDPADIAVLVDSRPEEVGEKLSGAGVPTATLTEYRGKHMGGVLIGTLRRSKGLEFKHVFIAGLSEADWPPRWFVSRDMPDEQRTERLALVHRSLFAGMTRARDRLDLLSGGEPCAVIKRAAWTLEISEY
jgi:mRNA-degrading endonuclease RelE of RelBE toxin-antitoxin system